MSTDQLRYPMDFSDRQDEWLDFDSLFQLPTGYLDSNPTSVESISPRDLEQSFTDAEFQNWDSDPAIFSQAMFPESAGYEASIEGFAPPALDSFQHFINPNDILQPISSQDQFVDPAFESSWLSDGQNLGSQPPFGYMVESQAALDTRCISKKEKRRDASIALHLQRLQNSPPPGFTAPSSSTQLSSPELSESSFETMPFESSCTTSTASPVSDSTQKLSSPASGPEPGAASMQLVLDLNMNTTTNVPRKQKPRSRAQRENYIKARKYGVCQKHRKQHKRCNCLEKAASAHLNSTTLSWTGLANTPGSRTNHERVRGNASTPCSVQSPAQSANVGPLRPLARQPTRAQKPELSTLPVSFPGHDRVMASNKGSLTPSGLGSPNLLALYRDKSTNTQHLRLRLGEERSRQVPRESVDSLTNTPCVSHGTLNVYRQEATNSPRTERGGALACAPKTAVGVFSFLQSSTTVSSLAGSFLRRLFVFSSALYMHSRGRLGFF
ncbi:uncharacterized protein BJX67DRAFT_45010 [Aspergillus lucknowensis]|uniref:BZIP domain-containing protein n=1 Tax=Aspergillus lucknowensis TaxID=176173 RepID=A0ABR4LVI9_9EURO